MENKNLALVAHEMSRLAEAQKAKANQIVCLKAHYLSKFLAAQAAKKRCGNCTCCKCTCNK